MSKARTIKINQLTECCDEQLCKDLTHNTGGTLTHCAIVDVLRLIIKRLVVCEENIMVAFASLHNIYTGPTYEHSVQDSADRQMCVSSSLSVHTAKVT